MPVAFAPVAAPTLFAPPLPPPLLPPGVSRISPFIRPGTLPITPPPLAPPPPLTVTPAVTGAGGALRGGAVGAAILGAGALGLFVGNEIYEDALGRPFGPSLGDLLFPQAQPQPLPVPEQLPEPGFCPAIYDIETDESWSDTTRFDFRGPGSNLGNYRGRYQGPFGSRSSAQRPGVDYVEIQYFIDAPASSQRVFIGSDRGIFIGYKIAVRFTRIDGLPDICFNPIPQPLPLPKSLPRPRPERPEELPYLPEPLRPPVPSRRIPFPFPDAPPGRKPEPKILPDPGPEPTLDPVPPPLKFPFPDPDPFPTPETEDSPLRRKPPKVPPVGTGRKTPPYECCPSIEQKLDDLIKRDECEPCDLTGVEELLRDVLERLEAVGSGEIDTTPCEGEEPESAAYSGIGLDGIFSAITAITSSLSAIHGNTRCEHESGVVAVPDWWQVRKGADTPQLSIILRKQGTRNYHCLNIPHPIVNPRPTTSPIDSYDAGQWQATIYLKDNSKFIVNAKLKSEAIRVATQAASLIQAEWLPSPLEISTTERRGFAINQSTMEPRHLEYHPEGQRSRRPLWRVNLFR